MSSREAEGAATDVQQKLALSTFAVRQKPVVAWTDASGAHREGIGAGRVLLGSSPHVQLRVHDPAVSRLHAELELRDGHVWVRDLGSTNGTWVDGVFVQSARLGAGSQLRVGATTISVSFAPDAAKTALWPYERLGPLVARSESMRELFFMLADFARTDSPVLIQGETGTGKELVARAIHESSRRSEGPFIVVDCGALPEALLEGELFGHVKGAFTGAAASRAGAFESADGGTVFLDEIGELPLSMQPKLLRVLESLTVRRLGEAQHRPVDVRFVSATHRDLRAMVANGSFREDVYFRLAVLPAFVPPLRDRPSDVGLLLEHFLASRAIHVRPEIVAEMERCPWRGNVRELRAFTERAIAVGPDRAWAMTRGLATGGSIAPPAATSTSTSISTSVATVAGDLPPVAADVPFKVLRERWSDHLEREYLKSLIARLGRADVGALAEAAGLDRSYVHRLLKKHDL
ncbi:MAG: sigma 54-interacting transcriptional regulator [Labilithrix sp.]|nr:sigma 54-interacting transcriptional regulator [Labilithrix sp.]MCW5810864.1 sigma 54-interacting transcriptional regulator [Labilithrix sp.]